LGGFLLFLFSFFFSFFYDVNLFKYILCFFPIFAFSIFEDTGHHLNPLLRLILIIFSCFFAIIYLYKNSQFDSYIYLYSLMLILLVYLNGNNMIDGANGILLFNSLLIIFYLIIANNQYDDFTLIFFFCLLLLFFMNYPKSFIFMGDIGAYFIPYIIFYFISIFPYNEFRPDLFIFLLYPIFEVFFTFTRRFVFDKVNPFSADSFHLHSLIFIFIKNRYNLNNSISNSLVLLVIIPVICSHIILFFIFKQNLLFSIFGFVFLYFIFYIFFANSRIRLKHK